MTANLSCGGTTAKYILLLFNLVIFVCGCALLGVGLYLKFDVKTTEVIDAMAQFDESNPYYKYAVIMTICLGLFLCLVGFFGCCGAWKENSCMLTMYAGLLILLIILEAIGIGMTLFARSHVDEFATSKMAAYIGNLHPETNYTMTKAWFALQARLGCCGINDYQDYENSRFENETTKAVPVTCCKLKDEKDPMSGPADYTNCLAEAKAKNTAGTDLLSEGCYDKLRDLLSGKTTLVAAVCFGIILVEIIGICFACVIRKQLSEYNKV